jgi:hypothetical protein
MIDKEVFIIGDPSLNLSIANANTTNTDLLIDIKEKTVFSGLIFEGLGNGQLIMKLDLNGDLEFYDSEISEKVEIQKL